MDNACKNISLSLSTYSYSQPRYSDVCLVVSSSRDAEFLVAPYTDQDSQLVQTPPLLLSRKLRPIFGSFRRSSMLRLIICLAPIVGGGGYSRLLYSDTKRESEVLSDP